MTDCTLAIIGGGASAAILLAHLAQRPDAKSWEIDVYDREGRFGRGIAYSTKDEHHLLNVRAVNMSAFYNSKDDFEIWAKARGFAADDFVPRPVFAQYLAQKMNEAVPHFSAVRFITDDVIDSKRAGDGFIVTTAHGTKKYRHVVVATGNVRALSPQKEDGLNGYYAAPWGLDYAQFEHCENIVLIGTGLSAVDAIQSLYRTDFKGTITTVSRNALFPAEHASAAVYEPFVDTGIIYAPSQLMKIVREHAAKAMAQNIPWQSVIDAMRFCTNTIWEKWDERKRSVFLRHAGTHWNIHRHRMAPENAAIIRSLQEQGRLVMVKDKVLKIAAPDKVVCAHRTLQADAIINCMGYKYDEKGRAFDADYRIGPARFGEMFETTAIPEIRFQADEIMQALKQ